MDGWYHAQKQWSGTNPARFNLTHEGDYKQCSSFKSSLSFSLQRSSLFSSVVPVRRGSGRDIIVRHVTIRDDFHLKRIVPRQPIHWIYAATLVFFIELDRTVGVLCMARYQRCRGRKTIFTNTTSSTIVPHDERVPRAPTFSLWFSPMTSVTKVAPTERDREPCSVVATSRRKHAKQPSIVNNVKYEANEKRFAETFSAKEITSWLCISRYFEGF